MVTRTRGRIKDWRGNRGIIVANSDETDASHRPFGDSWFLVRGYNMSPNPHEVPIEVNEEVAFLWGHERSRMIAFDVLRLEQQPTRAFLAHSSHDKPFVRKLAQRLVSADIKVWLDEWELRVGDSILERINHGLRESDYLVIVLSGASVSSSWVRRELHAALMQALSTRAITVLPVLKEACEIPTLIRDLYYADCSRNFDKGLRDLINAIKSTL
jgi:hypothetical protein